MPQVTVSIAGRTYRMACGVGEERHLESLAQAFDARINEMRKAFGEIGDMRLHVMAALTQSDELAEAQRRMAELERENAELRRTAEAHAAEHAAGETRLAESIGRTAERIETLAQSLMPAPAAP
ncbi:MAG: cell division protein ZapA [Methylobacterium frigidaeris]